MLSYTSWEEWKHSLYIEKDIAMRLRKALSLRRRTKAFKAHGFWSLLWTSTMNLQVNNNKSLNHQTFSLSLTSVENKNLCSRWCFFIYSNGISLYLFYFFSFIIMNNMEYFSYFTPPLMMMKFSPLQNSLSLSSCWL